MCAVCIAHKKKPNKINNNLAANLSYRWHRWAHSERQTQSTDITRLRVDIELYECFAIVLYFPFLRFASDNVYDSINFDGKFPKQSAVDEVPTKVPVPRLRRQNATDQQQSSETVGKPRRGQCSKSFIESMIPPPPPSPPVTSPPKDVDTDENDDENDVARFGAEAMEKLNKLYEMRNFLRSNSEMSADAANEVDEVVYRIREFKDFSRRSKRGSSKPMCSLVSVSVRHTRA